jgi:hypothetical protein
MGGKPHVENSPLSVTCDAPGRGFSDRAEAPLPDPYEVVSVHAVPAPSGTSGADWHRYEIRQGTNKIVGYRAGGIESVQLAVESIVVHLNERRRHRRGRVHVVLQSRARAAKTAS